MRGDQERRWWAQCRAGERRGDAQRPEHWGAALVPEAVRRYVRPDSARARYGVGQAVREGQAGPRLRAWGRPEWLVAERPVPGVRVLAPGLQRPEVPAQERLPALVQQPLPARPWPGRQQQVQQRLGQGDARPGVRP